MSTNHGCPVGTPLGRAVQRPHLSYPSWEVRGPGGGDTTVVHGYVVANADSTALSGAQVFVPSSGIGVLTDAEGRYSLRIPEGGSDSLAVQLFGFAGERLAVPPDGAVLRIDFGLVISMVCL